MCAREGERRHSEKGVYGMGKAPLYGGEFEIAVLSMDRSSEYPSDDFIGICIKAAAMAEQNPLRLP